MPSEATKYMNSSILCTLVGTDCAELNACEHDVRPSLRAVVDEAGTIMTEPSKAQSLEAPLFKVWEDVTVNSINK